MSVFRGPGFFAVFLLRVFPVFFPGLGFGGWEGISTVKTVRPDHCSFFPPAGPFPLPRRSLSTLSRPGSADGDAGETEPASLDADESRTEKTTAAETSAGESVAEEETVEGDESEGDDRPEDVS